MAELGVITDGISRELEHALGVIREHGLRQAELQYLWDKEVGDLNDAEIGRVQDLIQQYEMEVCCISRHNFVGMLVGQTEVADENHSKHIAALKRCIDMAKALDCELVRIMSFRKEMILFGTGGSEEWIVSTGAWEKLKQLLEPAIQLAENEGITLVVETGNNAIINSAYLGRKLVDEMGSSRLKILWDPGNSLFCNEPAFPDGYAALQGRYLGHIHIKDLCVDIPKATVDQCRFGDGQMIDFYRDLAVSLEKDNYNGIVSFESVYRPEDGTFEEGFRRSFPGFCEMFS